MKYKDGSINYQSRERVLSLEQDNAGFMMAMMNKDLDFLFNNIMFSDYCAIYGEWCGGNIQKGVALNGLEKMFVVFAIKADDEWIDLWSDLQDNEQGIYNILQFKTFDVKIDFNNPELVQNKLIEGTLTVEEECPVGKYFGVSGVGEGIVYSCVSDSSLKFKSKGEKHSVSKVKVLNSIDVEELNSIKEFVEAVVTDNRLQQGMDYLKEMNIEVSPKNTGEFLGWIVRDVLKEETDTIVANQLDMKKLKGAIVTKARIYYLKQYLKMVNNLEKILPLLKFESEDDFYYLQILQRKKDNPHIGANSKVIKNYYITSEKYLLDRFDEIKTLCDVFNARASLRLNKRSFEKVGFKAMTNMANTMMNKDFKFLKASYDRACGLGHNDKNKTWIVDVDKEEVIWLEQIISAIQPCEPLGDKIVVQLDSKTGLHLITRPFNTEQFKINLAKELQAYQMSPISIEIHKDNPTAIYIP